MQAGWAKIKSAARYCDVSERTMRGWLKEGLVYSRLKTGTILIQYSAIDEFLKGHEFSEQEADALANAALEGL